MFSMLQTPPKVSKENVKRGFHYNVFIPFQCAHGSAIMPPLRRQERLLLYTESVSALAGLPMDALPKNAEFVQK